jgi:DNA-binding MarR family transcriptional regulator
MDKEKLLIHGKFERIMALALKLEQAPKKFGTDDYLSHREIHLIELIGTTENLSVTDIAELTGVTKGAISQNLKKLENKGLSLKSTDPANLSRSIVQLSATGRVAFETHRQWHKSMDGGFSEYFKKLSKSETATIIDFMGKFENFLECAIDSDT